MVEDNAIRARDEASQLRRQLSVAEESLRRQTTRAAAFQNSLAKHPPSERGPRAWDCVGRERVKRVCARRGASRHGASAPSALTPPPPQTSYNQSKKMNAYTPSQLNSTPPAAEHASYKTNCATMEKFAFQRPKRGGKLSYRVACPPPARQLSASAACQRAAVALRHARALTPVTLRHRRPSPVARPERIALRAVLVELWALRMRAAVLPPSTRPFL